MAENKLKFYKTGKLKTAYHLLVRLVAKYWLKINPQVKIIAVVGSYGKTTTSQTIYKLLSRVSPTIVSDINLDTIYNIPLTILKLRKKHKYLVLEVGVDHKGEMDFHLELFCPHVVVFTGITPVHSDKGLLESLSGIIAEKSKIVNKLKKDSWLIANKDDKHVLNIAKLHGKKTIFYSTKEKGTDIYASNINVSLNGTSFVLNMDKKSIKLAGNFVGKQFIQSIMAAAAISHIEKINSNQLKRLASKTIPLKGRMSIEKGPKSSTLINDALRANPASTKAGLETLSLLKAKRKIAIVGEMGELGKYKVKKHQEIGELINQLNIDFLITVGPLTKHIANKVDNKKTKVYPVACVSEAASILTQKVMPKKNDVIYLKGSLLKHMERIILISKGKKVGCQVISCPFYNPCSRCKYLQKGYSD